MSFLTFGRLKRSGFAQVASADPESDEFRRLANESVDALLNRGDWRGTVAPIYVCVNSGCVTWPRYVHSVRKLNICNHEVPVKDVWYQFVDSDFYSYWTGQPYWNVVRSLNAHQHFREMNALGYFSTYNDVPTPSYIQAYPTLPDDVGKTVTVFGRDTNGDVLRTKGTDGIYRDGCVITMQVPYGQSPVALQPGAIRVIKDETQGDVRLYAADVSTGTLIDLAIYAPSEIEPSYSRYQLHARHNCGDGCSQFGVLALVKLEFIPVKYDGDLVLVNNIQALKFACQSIKKSEAGEIPESEAFMTKGVRELNLQLRNEQNDSQIPVIMKPFGTAQPSRAGIGRII